MCGKQYPIFVLKSALCDVNLSKDESNIISSAHVQRTFMHLSLLEIRHQLKAEWWIILMVDENSSPHDIIIAALANLET